MNTKATVLACVCCEGHVAKFVYDLGGGIGLCDNCRADAALGRAGRCGGWNRLVFGRTFTDGLS